MGREGRSREKGSSRSKGAPDGDAQGLRSAAPSRARNGCCPLLAGFPHRRAGFGGEARRAPLASTPLGLDSPLDAFSSPRGPLRVGSCEPIPPQRKPAGLRAGHRAAARPRTAAGREWGAGPGGALRVYGESHPRGRAGTAACAVFSMPERMDAPQRGHPRDAPRCVYPEAAVPRGGRTPRAAPRCLPAPGAPRTLCLTRRAARAALCPHHCGF